jgi:hypothetical protein
MVKSPWTSPFWPRPHRGSRVARADVRRTRWARPATEGASWHMPVARRPAPHQVKMGGSWSLGASNGVGWVTKRHLRCLHGGRCQWTWLAVVLTVLGRTMWRRTVPMQRSVSNAIGKVIARGHASAPPPSPALPMPPALHNAPSALQSLRCFYRARGCGSGTAPPAPMVARAETAC